MLRQTQRPGAPHSAGLSIHQQTLGLAMLGGRLVLAGRWRSGIQAHWCGMLCQGHEGERVAAPGAWAFRPPAMQQATGPGREWAGPWVAGRPGLQAAGCGHSCSSCFPLLPESLSSPSQTPRGSAQVHGGGVLQGGHRTASCVQPQSCSSKATWAGDLTSLSLSFPTMT